MVRPIQGMLDLKRFQEGAERIAVLNAGLAKLESKFHLEPKILNTELAMITAYNDFFVSLIRLGHTRTVPKFRIEFSENSGQYTVFIEEDWLEGMLFPHRAFLKSFT